MTEGQRKQKHINFSRAGGKASALAAALPGSSKYGGSTRLLERAETMNRRQKEIYGTVFSVRVHRDQEGWKRLKQLGQKAATEARRAKARARREVTP